MSDETFTAPPSLANAVAYEQSIYHVAMRMAGRDPDHELFSPTAKEYPLSEDDLQNWMRSWPRRACVADDEPSAWDYCRELMDAVAAKEIGHRRIDNRQGQSNAFATKVIAEEAKILLNARFGKILPVPDRALLLTSTHAEGSSSQEDDAAFGARQREASSRGGFASRKRPNAERCADFDAVRSRRPGLSKAAAYKAVASDKGESWQTIRDAVAERERRLKTV